MVWRRIYILYLGKSGCNGTAAEHEILWKLSLIKGPVTYYDVQKLFASHEENDERRALEFAADKMGVEKKMDFHRALEMLIILHVFFRK